MKLMFNGEEIAINAGAQYGDGLSVEDNTVNVDTPVRSVISQAEYDALSEAEQMKGLYIISDSEEVSEGSANEPFLVCFDASEVDGEIIFTCNKTHQQVREAITNKRPVIARLHVDTPNLWIIKWTAYSSNVVALYDEVDVTEGYGYPPNSIFFYFYVPQIIAEGYVMYMETGQLDSNLLPDNGGA